MSADVRKVLLRMKRAIRREARLRIGVQGDIADGLVLAVAVVTLELQKLDKPKRRATTKAAPKR